MGHTTMAKVGTAPIFLYCSSLYSGYSSRSGGIRHTDPSANSCYESYAIPGSDVDSDPDADFRL
jgi:hypothetical protein